MERSKKKYQRGTKDKRIRIYEMVSVNARHLLTLTFRKNLASLNSNNIILKFSNDNRSFQLKQLENSLCFSIDFNNISLFELRSPATFQRAIRIDHDHYLRTKEKRICFNTYTVTRGRINISNNIQNILEEVKSILGCSEYSLRLTSIIEEAYLKNITLAEATRYLVHQLFHDQGLIILYLSAY
jgi:hypothetical protein